MLLVRHCLRIDEAVGKAMENVWFSGQRERRALLCPPSASPTFFLHRARDEFPIKFSLSKDTQEIVFLLFIEIHLHL